jgi:flavin reductase
VELDLHKAMRTFATGVCIATTFSERPDGRRHDALTVDSLSPVSQDPPLVSMCLPRGSAFLADLLDSKVWALSVLDVSADDIAQAFAEDLPGRASVLQTLSTAPGERTGALILDAPSWMECTLHDCFDVGDRTIAVGEVVAGGVQHRRPPLIRLRGAFHALESTRPLRPVTAANREGFR